MKTLPGETTIHRALALFRLRPLTVTEVRLRLHCTDSCARRVVAELARRGELQPIGARPTGGRPLKLWSKA